MNHWLPAYIGLGSNLEQPEQQLQQAFSALAALPETRLIRRSSLYRSDPVGITNQPDFLNAVVGVLTQLNADQLMAQLLRIEQQQGRSRTGERWGPRTLDLDLLWYGQEIREEKALTLPHPRIAERNFVLLPLEEIAPFSHVPGLGPLSQLVSALTDKHAGIERIEE